MEIKYTYLEARLCNLTRRRSITLDTLMGIPIGGAIGANQTKMKSLLKVSVTNGILKLKGKTQKNNLKLLESLVCSKVSINIQS